MKTETELKPKFHKLKFKSQAAYDKWLKLNTHKKIYFEETGGDFCAVSVAESGEIIDCELYTMNRIYLGGFVDLEKLEVGKPIVIRNVLGNKEWKAYKALIVFRINHKAKTITL